MERPCNFSPAHLNTLIVRLLAHLLACLMLPARAVQLRDVVFPLPTGDWHELQAGLQQQHSVPYPFSIQHCEKSRAVVMVLSDGSCALLGVPSTGARARGRAGRQGAGEMARAYEQGVWTRRRLHPFGLV